MKFEPSKCNIAGCTVTKIDSVQNKEAVRRIDVNRNVQEYIEEKKLS